MEIRKKFTITGVGHIVRNCTSERCKKSMHAHTYDIELYLSSENDKLDNGHMVYDFGLFANEIKTFIKSFENSYIAWDCDDSKFRNLVTCYFNRYIIMKQSPSAERLSRMFMYYISKLLAKTNCKNDEGKIQLNKVRVHETRTGWAECVAGGYNDDDVLITTDIDELYNIACLAEETHRVINNPDPNAGKDTVMSRLKKTMDDNVAEMTTGALKDNSLLFPNANKSTTSKDRLNNLLDIANMSKDANNKSDKSTFEQEFCSFVDNKETTFNNEKCEGCECTCRGCEEGGDWDCDHDYDECNGCNECNECNDCAKESSADKSFTDDEIEERIIRIIAEGKPCKIDDISVEDVKRFNDTYKRIENNPAYTDKIDAARKKYIYSDEGTCDIFTSFVKRAFDIANDWKDYNFMASADEIATYVLNDGKHIVESLIDIVTDISKEFNNERSNSFRDSIIGIINFGESRKSKTNIFRSFNLDGDKISFNYKDKVEMNYCNDTYINLSIAPMDNVIVCVKKYKSAYLYAANIESDSEKMLRNKNSKNVYVFYDVSLNDEFKGVNAVNMDGRIYHFIGVKDVIALKNHINYKGEDYDYVDWDLKEYVKRDVDTIHFNDISNGINPIRISHNMFNKSKDIIIYK